MEDRSTHEVQAITRGGAATVGETAAGRRIRVLLVENHGPLRRALGLLLGSQAAIDLVGEAGNGPDAVTAAERLQADVVLIEIDLPLADGLLAIRHNCERGPERRVLALGGMMSEIQARAALAAGADGYVDKGAGVYELLGAIYEVHQRGPIAGAGFGHAAIEPALPILQVPGLRPDLLTNRERWILRLAAGGSTDRAIAGQLYLSVGAVQAQRAAAMAKLRALSGTRLVHSAPVGLAVGLAA